MPGEERSSTERLVGFCMYTLVVAASGGILLGILGIFFRDWGAAAQGLLATGLASGLLANALLRK
jgi:hypothetical protein